MAHPIRRLAAPAVLSALALACSAAPAFAAGTPPGDDGSLDVRDSAFLAEPPASITARADALRASLGDQGVVELDAISQTPRFVAKLDGYLSGPSAASAPQVALGYVRAHSGVFGLDAGDLAGLKLARERVTPDGVHHVVFAQTVDGIPVFDRDLRANVAADGRLVNVLGAPLRELALPSTTPALSAPAALRSAMASVGGTLVPVTAEAAGDALQTTAFSDGSDARLTIFPSASGPRLAWRLVVDQDSQHLWHSVVDATSGDVLYRENLVKFATGAAWSYFPGPLPFNGGGNALIRDFTPWLGSAGALSGPNVHTYMDVNDDGVPGPADEIPPAGGNWNYAFTPASPLFGNCDPPNFECSWNGNAAGSWTTNAYQNATQVFYFVNNFHDHLELDANIQFGNASGNFEGNDPVQAQTLDGANLDSGFPDGHHINNANMATREDGVPPRMQMYLFNGNNYLDANGGDDASIIYHEYVHGLSARLVTDAAGFPALRGGQAGAMGEAWSDWYAMDYLMLLGFDSDTATVGDVNVGCYVSLCQSVIRSEPLDCKVGSDPTPCPGGGTAGSGGYTYGDYGRISGGGPEVHADGEIWAQALWDLRAAITPDVAQQVVTRGMDLSPPAPSMLDMRNAIIQADLVNFGGAHVPTIWQVFATRGMGWFASALSSSDPAPVESFALPPGGAAAQITGTVTDVDTAAPIGGASVRLPGHVSGFASDLATTTAASGGYAIGGVPAGTYPHVLAQAGGYEPSVAANVSAVAGGAARVDFRLKRDYAALSGGAIVRSVTPPDLTSQGCGPAGAFDISLGTAWGSTSPASTQGPGGPKAVVLELPIAVNVATYMIDPGAGCGDDDGAATAGFTVETSTDGVTYTVSASGTFAAANNHKLNPVAPTAAAQGVRFIRLTMLNQQNPASPSGKDYMDLSEFEIYGLPTPGQGGGGGGGGVKDTKAPQGRFALFGKKPKLGAALKSGVKIRVRCNEACTATPSLLLSVKQAKKLKLGRTVTAALSGKIAANKYRVFTVKFTSKAKTKLKKLKTVTLTMAVGVKDAAGNKARGTSSLTLKR